MKQSLITSVLLLRDIVIAAIRTVLILNHELVIKQISNVRLIDESETRLRH